MGKKLLPKGTQRTVGVFLKMQESLLDPDFIFCEKGGWVDNLPFAFGC